MGKYKKQNPYLLATNNRGGLVENLFYGWICVLNKKKELVYKKGNVKNYAFLRSCAKPIQAIETLKSNLPFTEKELAIICSSHTGSKKHQQILNLLINKYNINPKLLKCGIHQPFDENEKKYLQKNNLSPNILHNNCSGKHLGILCICKKNNFSTVDYLTPNHPLQTNTLKTIKELSEYQNIKTAIDGCGLPTFYLPIINIAYLFSNFSSNKSYTKIINSMRKYPFLIGGHGQIDSELMNLSKDKLICKVGADGMIFVANDGESLIIKIADGNPKIRAFVLLRTLVKLGWIEEKTLLNSPLKDTYLGDIKNISGNIVGNLSINS